MAYLRAEEVLMPLRFLFLTAHFVAILAVVFGLESASSSISQVNPNNPKVSQSDLDDYNSTKKKLSAWAYVALGCCSAEYLTLFLGASIFIRPLQLLNIQAHVCGVILVILWYYNSWSVSAFIAYAVVFNILPITIELVVLAFLSRFTFAHY